MEVVKSWPRPTRITDVRSFLRLAGYYCSFVREFFVFAKPLSALAENGRVFAWSSDCEQAFRSAPILAFPHAKGEIIPSDTGLGAVLSQELRDTVGATRQSFH